MKVPAKVTQSFATSIRAGVRVTVWIVAVISNLLIAAGSAPANEYETEIVPLLQHYCFQCHSGETANGEIDLAKIHSFADAKDNPDDWETIARVIEDAEMPPQDAEQLSDDQRALLLRWINDDFFGDIESLPGPMQIRRLSGPEYRNTLRSILGFDLEVSVVKAEQTVTETSLVLKLLPTDPPGSSGYINDTHSANISTTIWNQYAYLAEIGLQRFLDRQTIQTDSAAEAFVRDFVSRAYRRPAPRDKVASIMGNLRDRTGPERMGALKEELKLVLLSPAFLYRGLLVELDPSKPVQQVDDFELAERLSYFLWEDMPDVELTEIASRGKLNQPEILREQVDRMLTSKKSRSLASSFGAQWLLLDQIKHQRRDPPYEHALRNQPIEFLHYLIRENRPVIELIDSDVTFINSMIGNFYGDERKQLRKVIKPKGIERMTMPLQRVTLGEFAVDRGAGILTMPGVLAMNRGPILRGTWILRQILGEHLGEPPPDVPPIQAAIQGKQVSFRDRFEVHRSDQSCAICHDRIDPLGFALEGYGDDGGVIGKNHNKKGKKKNSSAERADNIDTSGTLPSGESFSNFQELRELLKTSQRERIVRNTVEQMLAYALCRQLIRSDRPTVDELTDQILETNGTWRDLILGIAQSVPFTQTMTSPDDTSRR